MTAAVSTWTLTARWLFPVDRPPLEHGTLILSGERIIAVEPRSTRPADVDLGDCAVLPGLVNAHTHLDLSGLRGQCPPVPDFTQWLRAVIRNRRATTPEQTEAAVRAGLAESLRCGTTLIGDVTSQGASWPVLEEATLRSVVFYELIGLPLNSAVQAAHAGDAWRREHASTSRCRIGVSPHAPYSVRDMLFNGAARASRIFGGPLATHLAETPAELELLAHQSGPFAVFLQELGVWDPYGLVADVGQVVRACAAAPQALFVHCNYLPTTTAIPAHGSIVYCPRTHAAFGHAPHPFRDFLARGVRVALGTDSLASNPDLDMLAELRFLHAQCPDVPGATLLRMATLSGAEALGFRDQSGSLTPGKSADLVALPLPREKADDPHTLILESAERVKAVLWRGQWTGRSEEGR